MNPGYEQEALRPHIISGAISNSIRRSWSARPEERTLDVRVCRWRGDRQAEARG